MKPKVKLVANTEITVDKSGPPPPPRPLHKNLKYPWHDMDVGDSFVVPETKVRGIRSVAEIASLRYGKRFVHGMDPRGQTRVWRTE